MPGTRTILKFSHFVNRTEAKEPQWSYPPVGGEPSENTSILSSPPVGSGDLSEKGQDGFPITNVGNDEAGVRRCVGRVRPSVAVTRQAWEDNRREATGVNHMAPSILPGSW